MPSNRLAVVAILSAACGTSLVDDPFGPLPKRLASVGLYPDPSDRDTVHPRAAPFSPTWPLWTNGADKDRYVLLPEGTAIDTSDPEAWRYPEGTLVFKTFTYARTGPVETRVMRLGRLGLWDYGTYVWKNADRATLYDGRQTGWVDLGEGQIHSIPGTLACRKCHESARSEVLGLVPAQLPDGPPVPTTDDVTPDPVVAEDPETEQILGWFQGNCVHCHNGGFGDNSAFDLRHDVAVENTVGVATSGSASAEGIRIDPGSPETSVVYLAVTDTGDDPDLLTMPPLGVDTRDRDSLDHLFSWIFGL